MSVVRFGSTSTYAAGWDAIFGGGKAGRTDKGKGGAKKSRVAGKAAKRKTKAKPAPVKAARKARKKQAARKQR